MRHNTRTPPHTNWSTKHLHHPKKHNTRHHGTTHGTCNRNHRRIRHSIPMEQIPKKHRNNPLIKRC